MSSAPSNALLALMNLPPQNGPGVPVPSSAIPSWVSDERKVWNQGRIEVQPPPGYIFPVSAFDEAGVAIWEEEWTCNEMRVSFLPMRPMPSLNASDFSNNMATESCIARHGETYRMAQRLMSEFGEYDEILPPDKLTFSKQDWEVLRAHSNELRTKWTSARIRRNTVIQHLCDRAASGDIKTVYRTKGGGQPHHIPAEWWQLDSYLFRFSSCGLNPDAPYDPFAERTAWFFFEKKSFEAAIAPQETSTREAAAPSIAFEDAHLSPYIRLMIEIAQLTKIGPEPHQQVPKDSLEETIKSTAELRGLELSGKDVDKMATFIREPGMKAGSRKVLADLKRKKAG